MESRVREEAGERTCIIYLNEERESFLIPQTFICFSLSTMRSFTRHLKLKSEGLLSFEFLGTVVLTSLGQTGIHYHGRRGIFH